MRRSSATRRTRGRSATEVATSTPKCPSEARTPTFHLGNVHGARREQGRTLVNETRPASRPGAPLIGERGATRGRITGKVAMSTAV